jgi:hypothetical protein
MVIAGYVSVSYFTYPTDGKHAECDHMKKKGQGIKKISEAESFKHTNINR